MHPQCNTLLLNSQLSHRRPEAIEIEHREKYNAEAMKRLTKVYVIMLILLLAGLMVYPHDTSEAGEEQVFTYESTYYLVQSFHSQAQAKAGAKRLDAYFDHFNSYFHFDFDQLGYKLRVHLFNSQATYDTYLTSLVAETSDEFAFLHYNDPSQSELVGAIEADGVFDQSFTHQAFVQFIRSFIHDPPLWLREGFAVFFEEIIYDESSETVEPGKNLPWLDTLKSLLFGERKAELLGFQQVLSINLDTAKKNIETFTPQIWGMVYYLVNTDNREHNRVLWDAINALEGDANLLRNSSLLYEKSFEWIGIDNFEDSLRTYFNSIKTYAELIEEGIASYDLGDFDEAEKIFQQAIAHEDNNHIPHYFLGLINFNRGNYAAATANYQQALAQRQNNAFIYYALGLNALANNQQAEANEYLETTIQLDPDGFTEKAGEILEKVDN